MNNLPKFKILPYFHKKRWWCPKVHKINKSLLSDSMNMKNRKQLTEFCMDTYTYTVGDIDKYQRKVIITKGTYERLNCNVHTMHLRKRARVPIRACALDPGYRTFQTLYDTNNRVVEFGKDDIPEDQNKAHKQIIKYLLKNYNIIFIPILNCPRLSEWRHQQFFERLKNSAAKTKTRVFQVDEKYTTKTCTVCAKFNFVGGCKTFYCGSCGLQLNRDVNGARNILLKSMKNMRLQLKK